MAAAKWDFIVSSLFGMVIETNAKPIHNRNTMKAWSRAAAVATCIVLAGCADGAKLFQEDDRGGVVIYPFKEDQGAMLSSFRKDALAIMKDKCNGGPYVIVREGETKGRARHVSPIAGAEEIVQERRWGIQFQCK
jgi:hypothetical protein